MLNDTRVKSWFWLCVVLVLVGCQPPDWPTDMGGDVPAHAAVSSHTGSLLNCTIEIGIITQFNHDGGREHLQGYQVGLDDINASGGVHGCRLALVQKNDAGSAAVAERMVIELANEGVPLILGAYSSGATLAAGDKANDIGMPLIIPTASSDLITAMGHEWVFRVNAPSSGYVAQALAFTNTQIAKGREKATVGIVYENSVFGESAAVAMSQRAEAQGLSIVAYERFTPRNTSNSTYSAILRRVRTAEPDMVYLIANNRNDAIALLRQSRLAGLQPQAFIANAGAFITNDFLAEAGELAEDLIVTTQWAADVENWTPNSQRDAFVSAFRAQYPDEVSPSMRTAATYTVLQVAKTALESLPRSFVLEPATQVALREEVRRALVGLNLEQTLYGPIDFDAQGQNQHPVLLVQVQNGRFVTIYPNEYRATSWQTYGGMRP